MKQKTLVVGLGSNLGDRKMLLQKAAEEVGQRIGKLVQLSSFYETRPVGFRSSHDFLNAVAVYHTTRSAEEILAITEAVEREMGRSQKSSQGVHYDRLIDIDLLMLDNDQVNIPNLTLPHPELPHRRFVLEPLCEVMPNGVHPVLQLTYRELLQQLNRLHIEEVKSVTDDDTQIVNTLLSQLTSTPHVLDFAALTSLVQQSATHLYFGCDEEGQVRAMYTLCESAMPTGHKAWVEDVVVDASARGRSYGTQLLQHAIAEAKRMGIQSLNLTSRPTRVAANALYQKIGFVQRDTNVYRYDLR